MTVVLDADQRDAAARRACYRVAHHVVFSAEGLRATAGIDDLDAALRDRRTDAFVAVTDGAAGHDLARRAGDAAARCRHSGSHAVDTLGAGDVFHGAFALALAEGQDIADAMRFAAAASAIKCTRFGGGLGAPTGPRSRQLSGPPMP